MLFYRFFKAFQLAQAIDYRPYYYYNPKRTGIGQLDIGWIYYFQSIYETESEKNKQRNTKYCSRMVGFDARNKDDINPLYLCRSCTLILREPFQLACGHRQCKTCIESIEG
jgi:hypothetical protein